MVPRLTHLSLIYYLLLRLFTIFGLSSRWVLVGKNIGGFTGQILTLPHGIPVLNLALQPDILRGSRQQETGVSTRTELSQVPVLLRQPFTAPVKNSCAFGRWERVQGQAKSHAGPRGEDSRWGLQPLVWSRDGGSLFQICCFWWASGSDFPFLLAEPRTCQPV